jgi:hypothetical protein
MRPLALSLAVVAVSLAAGVVSHHLLTTGNASSAYIVIVVGAFLNLLLSVPAIMALKKNPNIWIGFLSGFLHALVAYSFLQIALSSNYSVAFKTASWGATISSAFCGLLIILPRSKEEPVRSPQPFKAGDTVYDTWDQEYTVTAVDPTGNHGIGSIWIKRKKDGFLSAQAFAGNDLTHTKKRE